MRTTGVSLFTAPNSAPISFTLRDADPMAQYSVRNILGLDADEIIHKFYGTSLVSGLKYYDAGLKPREIVMNVSLEPRFRQDESYSDVRDSLYRAISSNRTGQVGLRFENAGTVVAEIKGSISRVEATHFAQKPEVTLTISCVDPMFRAMNPVEIAGEDLPTSNPLRIVDGVSTAPHGFHTHMTFTSAAASFTIQDTETNPEWKFKIVPSGGFLVGDELHLETDYMQNHLHLMRASNVINLVDSIEPGSVWPIIFPGVNEFSIVENLDGDFRFTWVDLEYYPAYWGV
jgi:hypothetical protein